MKRFFILAAITIFAVLTVRAQVVSPAIPAKSPNDVVEWLWCMATRGDLLAAAGWSRAARSFTQPSSSPMNKDIVVMSNYWGSPQLRSITAKAAVVLVEYEPAGQIDSVLHYKPPQESSYGKMWLEYHLAWTPTHTTVFKEDGKTVEREISGPEEWKIEGSAESRWTTVNAAICYVLEMRSKTTDPTVKANADKTIAALMHYR